MHISWQRTDQQWIVKIIKAVKGCLSKQSGKGVNHERFTIAVWNRSLREQFVIGVSPKQLVTRVRHSSWTQ
jgi:hypothetical protein